MTSIVCRCGTSLEFGCSSGGCNNLLWLRRCLKSPLVGIKNFRSP